MQIDKNIIILVADHVRTTLTNQLPDTFCYHNISHTEAVVKAVTEIGKAMNVPAHERRILQAAAWFHDLGYVEGITSHEEKAVPLATRFLEKLSVDSDDITRVVECIRATAYPQNPKNTLEKVICDADLIHVGSKTYSEKASLIRKEWEETKGEFYTEEEWKQVNVRFLSEHCFHTEYCQLEYTERKRKNMKKWEGNVQSVEPEQVPMTSEAVADAEKFKLHRGVETLFRTASRNHMQLSSMADSKAHILMSINSIIISIIISVLLKKLEQSPYLVLPTVVLLAVCTLSVVFAVLTTKPKISKGVFTREQVAKREANLLFFGNFHKMDIETYDWGIREMMANANYLYGSMTRDIYFMGKILAVKYKYLSVGYSIFMIGMITSVCLFGICFAFH